MTKSIRSYPEHKRVEVIIRRLKNSTMGMGYWAAVDAVRHLPKMYQELIFESLKQH